MGDDMEIIGTYKYVDLRAKLKKVNKVLRSLCLWWQLEIKNIFENQNIYLIIKKIAWLGWCTFLLKINSFGGKCFWQLEATDITFVHRQNMHWCVNVLVWGMLNIIDMAYQDINCLSFFLILFVLNG